jgi:hypothetical protein
VRLRSGAGVAIDTSQVGMHALHVGRCVDRDAFALRILQSGGRAVAEQAIGGLLGSRFGSNQSGEQEKEGNKHRNYSGNSSLSEAAAVRTTFRRNLFRAGPDHCFFPDSG